MRHQICMGIKNSLVTEHLISIWPEFPFKWYIKHLFLKEPKILCCRPYLMTSLKSRPFRSFQTWSIIFPKFLCLFPMGNGFIISLHMSEDSIYFELLVYLMNSLSQPCSKRSKSRRLGRQKYSFSYIWCALLIFPMFDSITEIISSFLTRW